ncbi:MULTISPECIES: ATP synthase subunit I [Romboutsia]|uniref:ATP synthase I chain n=1 Tax=Romboutsia hominis TaxID=1507512 RepID=A0A2P2BMH0_9FIRM|nr:MULTISPECIES: ATP synthase subunit I [Romboutsia]MCH1958714.1 ATP synthase subunit I [Romboutsia hominis]MCH1970630.1 ATP synthase subunit I [Romboutsia hominis]MDB8789948.1 ATP synthase subunit I [Romboutsia sp. 1001216sp1]MDB8794341.1 ATP synthase subunit I [Romboutsia sp. 1001216sp1]MDB8797292.1 ATP synthase subunit I [Romboutsia sp. 1001216sp1]
MHTKLQDEINYVTKGVIVYDLIAIILLLITSTFSKEMLLGLIFGTIIAVLNFRLLAITIEKSVTMPVSKAQIYSAGQYLLRMTVTGVVLFVSVKAPYIHVLGVAIGLLSPKFVILTKTFLIDKLKRKEA